MTKDQAIEAIGDLAHKLRFTQPRAAVVLFTLSGSMRIDCEDELARMAVEVARVGAEEMKAQLAVERAKLN